MLRNYIKITLRNLYRHKLYTVINLIGLTLGLTCALLITAYVLDELTYDRFHRNADRIVLLQQLENSATSGGKLGLDFNQQFAQVEQMVRLKKARPLITCQTASAYEDNFFFADSTAFEVFTFPLVQGNQRTALTEQYGVVISEAMAQKYFPGQNPLGQLIRYDTRHTLHITGVMRNLPGNSHQRIDFLANYANANELIGYDVTTNLWGGSAWTYLLLAPDTQPEAIEAQFPAYLKQLNDPNVGIWKLHLIPLTDLYLKTDLIAPNRLTYVTIFSVVALLILLLAAFNYVNLATARATARAKEVGVRKVLGSTFGQLARQFMGETLLFVLLALGLTALLVPTLLPAFNQLAEKQLAIATLFTPRHGLWLLLGISVLCLTAGGYPAFVLSSFRPASVLKGTIGLATSSKTPLLRHSLVIGQFTVSIIMIVATLVVYTQLDYIQHKQLGYSREQVLVMDLRDAPEPVKLRFKEQINRLSGVVLSTRSLSVPGSGALITDKLVSDYAPAGVTDLSISRQIIDEDFLSTFDIKLKQGRNLDDNRPVDQKAFLVNEAAMAYFGWKNLNGKMLGYYTFEYDQTGNYREVPQRGPVVGVVANYHQKNLRNAIAPLLFSLTDGATGMLSVKLRPGAVPVTVQQIEVLWKQSFPNWPFDYEFMDDFFTRTYRSDVRTGQVFGLFSALAVLISCLGLFGLATFTAESRTKEIGVRKVLGASVLNLIGLLSKDFLKLVLVAIVIALPLAWYAMNQWLADFAYKINIEWWMFVMAGALAILIALITVSFQSMKAALMNPVKSLRSE